MKNKLSVVLATRNEEANIARCLESVKDIADEIVVVDENSIDKTREIAKNFNAKVYLDPHHEIFHITKQKALDYAKCEWILQLDADEEVTPQLAKEIKLVISNQKLEIPPGKQQLFARHQSLIEKRDGQIGNKKGGPVVAFFIPRLNMFLGHAMKHGGVYPDGVIRLIKKGRAKFPQKSVHEQIEVDGEVSWLFNDLRHYDSPTLSRYLSRFNRYTDLKAAEFKSGVVNKNFLSFLYFTFWKPLGVFSNIYFRHKGFLDGPQGFLWAFFSAMHFPVGYYKYLYGN